MKKTVMPVGKYVLLRMVPEQEQKGGFYMPESQKQRAQKGQILGLGKEVEGCSVEQTAIAKPDKGKAFSVISGLSMLILNRIFSFKIPCAPRTRGVQDARRAASSNPDALRAVNRVESV